MRKVSYFILICIFYFITSPVVTEGAEQLTLEKSVEIALAKNPAIYAAIEGVKGAQYNKKSAFSGFLPKLSTSYSYTRLNEEESFDLGLVSFTVVDKESYEFSLTLEQPIYAGRALVNTYKRSKIGVEIARMREEQARQDIVLQVKEAYFGILKAEKIKEVAEQAVKQIESQVRRAKEFYNAEMIPKNDLLQTEVQLAQAKQDLIKAKNGIDIAKSIFNTILRRGIGEDVEVEDILKYEPVAWELEESISIALKERPELKELDLNIEEAEKVVDLTKSDYHPNIYVAGSYQKEGETASVDEEDGWAIMAVAEWTFWEWGKTAHKVNESKTGLAIVKYAKEQMKDKVTLEVKESYLNIKEAEKNILVAEKAIEQAEENFRINEERYKEQIATSTEVLDAQTLLTQTRTNYYNALNDYNIAKARLERAIGVGYLKE
ncbi:MAG: TolC family protein [Thermodesulfobacteriota bacterium]|nr:TolC family protein [Thermodesulfobacteriota bacterium]